MKIAVNTRFLIKDRLEGIGWFTYEHLKRIVAAHPEHEFYFLFDRAFDKEFIFAPNVHPVIVRPRASYPLLWITWFEWALPRAIRKINPDIFVSPDGFLSLKLDIPQVIAIHDINFYHRSQDIAYIEGWYLKHYFPKFASKAQRIVTVSEYTKQDIVSSFAVSANKIDVVYNGAHENYRVLTDEEQNGTKARYSMGSEYFLFVGAQHPRKNIDGLLKAFNLFKTTFQTDHKLIIVGEKKFLSQQVEDTYKAMEYKNEVLFTGRLSSEDIALVMGSALALVFIPFFEGFGIPMAEAMYAEIPIIASNTTSMPEVAGDAAIYVDPTDLNTIVEAMNRMASNADLRTQLIENGRKRRVAYNWDVSAKALWNAIERSL